MITLKALHPDHFPALFEIEQREYPEILRAPGYKAFCDKMLTMQGFTFMDGDRVVGTTHFQDAGNGTDVYAHSFMDRNYVGKWATRKNARTVYHFPFCVLGKTRVSIPLIKDSMPRLERMLFKIGFKVEGIIRKSLLLHGEVYDITLLGLIEEDLRF